MHGVIVTELKKFVEASAGPGAWNQVLEGAGQQGRIYLPIQTYPDADVVPLVRSAVRLTGLPQDDVLEQFGEFAVPRLMSVYRAFVRPEWRALDLIENTEQAIHTAVRARDPGADPPRLQAKRTAPDEVVVNYSSPRRLCAVAKGIARGVAKHFGEQVTISEPSCMKRGGAVCQIVVRKVG